MKNLFDADNYPDSEPSSLSAGERWAWKRSDITAAYPAATYTLKYLLTLQTSTATQIEITAGKVSSEHVVEVSQTTTAEYVAGDYAWQAIIIRDSDSEELVIGEGYLNIVTQTGDGRSHTLIVLQAIRATIEGTASKDQQEYSISGRTLKRRSIPELIELEKYYSSRWKAEKAALDRENGRKTPNKTLVQMSA